MPARDERDSNRTVSSRAPAAGEDDRSPAALPLAGASSPNPDWDGSHPIDLRITIPFPFGRYYVTIVAGKERRSAARLQRERRKHPLVTAGNVAFLLLLGSITGLAALAAIQFFGAVILRHLGLVDFS